MITDSTYYQGLHRKNMIAYYLLNEPLEAIEWGREVLEIDIELEVYQALAMPENQQAEALATLAKKVCVD